MRSSAEPAERNQIVSFIVPANGAFPNNERLPVLLYRAAFAAADNDLAGEMERRFRENGWSGGWRDGIYPFAHYHSTTHEVLGIAAGDVTVQLGGPDSRETALRAGDVVVLPAGVAHRNLGASDDLLVIGAYPGGRHGDMNRGAPGERPETDQQIAHVPLPAADPVFGENGPLLRQWHDP